MEFWLLLRIFNRLLVFLGWFGRQEKKISSEQCPASLAGDAGLSEKPTKIRGWDRYCTSTATYGREVNRFPPLPTSPLPEKRLSKGNEYLMAKNMSRFFSRQTAWRELFIDSIPAGRMAPPPRIHMNSWYVCMTSKRKPFFCCANDVQQKVGVQKRPCSIVYSFSPSLRFKVDGAAGLCPTYSHTWKKALIVIWPKILLRVLISSF